MSGGIFYLDEDRDRDTSPSPSPRSTPPPPSDPSASTTSHSSQPTHASSQTTSASSPSFNAPSSGLPTLQIPQNITPLLSPTPQPFERTKASHRRAAPFAATPSFSSPLAQAVTVPLHSDTSSSSSHSSGTSDEENEHHHTRNFGSPHVSAEGTPRKGSDPLRPRTASPRTSRSASPASTQKSASRPPSPSRQALTPGALLMKNKRSGSGSGLGLSGNVFPPTTTVLLKESPPRPIPAKTEASPTHPATRRFGEPGSPRARSGSNGSTGGAGSSSLASSSPELFPLAEGSSRRRSSSISNSSRPDMKEGGTSGNVLGLGWGGGWESSGGISGSGSWTVGAPGKDKGKGKDSGPPSPKTAQRERERTAPVGIASPSRARRPSEFLNPSSLETRKMPIVSGGRTSLGSGGQVASLSTSASMISPLNPLPSPWTTSSDLPTSSFSPAYSTASEASTTTTSSSAGGAMRLNRVPTSVRLAAELIKTQSTSTSGTALSPIGTQTSDSPPSGGTTGSIPTPNPSPAASSSDLSRVPPPSSRELGNFTSLPIGQPKPIPLDIGKGRPTLSVPGTPLSRSRDTSPSNERAPALSAGARQSSAGSTLAPPSAFKTPQLPVLPRQRPSLPSDTAGLAEPFSGGTSRLHKYRVSMHEAYRPSVGSDITEGRSTSDWQVGQDQPAASTSLTKEPGLGLGLNMKAASAFSASLSVASGAGTGSITPGGAPPTRRNLASPVIGSGGKSLEMDLAGMNTLGDAASHASMIMQSRQAKLQRWRPNSAGSQTGREEGGLPPAFNRSTTSGTPAMLAGPRADRQAQWGLKPSDSSATAASSPGEDLPPIPLSGMMDLHRVATIAYDPRNAASPDQQRAPLHSNIGPSRFSPPQAPGAGLNLAAVGPIGMERTSSASGTIGGIEWVDWYDCYKRYKEAKIRAEAEVARKVNSLGVSPKEMQGEDKGIGGSKQQVSEEPHRSSPREIDLTSEGGYAIALTPTTSRDDYAGSVSHQGSLRRRSMSIRSTLSAFGGDPASSPRTKRSSIFERPRQVSGSSTKSADNSSVSTSQQVKKKKNLVNKMEGWWNAVKSNFVPEHHQQQHQHQPHRPSNLGAYVSQRIPSAPTSRRGSDMSPIAPPAAVLLAPDNALHAPGMIRRDSAANQSLRQATSHAELRSSREAYDAAAHNHAAGLASSISADIGNLSRKASADYMPPPRMIRDPSPVAEEDLQAPSAPGMSNRPFSSAAPSIATLESRRKGPGQALRLELEPNVLTMPNSSAPSRGSDSSGGQNAPSSLRPAYSQRPTESSSRSSSYGQTFSGPGLTPGVPKWDQTPSPLYALSAEARAAEEDRPVAPGAEITVASVRRHIKHRLNAAKEACDATLRKTSDAMARFAEEQKHLEELERERLRRDDEERLAEEEGGALEDGYFDEVGQRLVSDSPIVDVEDSEVDEVKDGDGMGKTSRTVSTTSRPQSRRPSISRPGASPSKRPTMLPASPNRPTRRRPSAAPRSYTGRDVRVGRNLSLSLDRTTSATSSRSTSRSHSPMPPSSRTTLIAREGEDHSDRKFLTALQDLIVLATDVLELGVNSLLSRTSICTEVIQKLQKVGAMWDEHGDWPGREWYVDILMAVANLSRVLDWWEAEKGFWNFDYEDENEPLLFVMKPTREETSQFDRDFKAALAGQPGDRASPASSTLLLPEVQPPKSATSLEVPSPETSGPFTAKPLVGTPKAQAVEDLRFLAEHAKSVNIVMELSLQGEEVQYINDAILEVTGREPDDVLYKPITDLLAPADASIFADATQKLMEDDNNTVQLRFRFEVHELNEAEQPDRQPGPMYIELEGVGMLMRENDEPSHTMWVLKPVPAQVDTIVDAVFPLDGNVSTEGILCRICERKIVTWFFEKHNETCDAVHRLEAEISLANECLHDVHQMVLDLAQDIDNAVQPGEQRSQYQGVLFFQFPESLTSGSDAVPADPQAVELRKIADDNLQDVIEVLEMAQEIETPSVQEDEADLPFNVQRYLSPESEAMLNRITRWQRPHTTDRALGLLYLSVENQLRRKQKAIARMQSTIRYSEKTRHEWEDKVNQMVAEMDRDENTSDSGGSDGSGNDNGQTSPTEAQTPQIDPPENSPPGHRKIAPAARLPITQGHPGRPSTAHGEQSLTTTVPPTPIPAPTPVSMAPPPPPSAPPLSAPGSATSQHLALPPTIVPTSAGPFLAKPSSPLLVPVDSRGHSRRVSTSKQFREGPLSPRIPSAALQSRAAPPSIKDFEIIKPISRGAFGSVYLAKKVTTGDYFAIKALKKSDMIAKNQITNVKAERTILMNQASSPYVVKLFFSFQSKEYLYLVMEYLNGGDCATLVKTLGGLSEDWARNYIAEVVLGLEYLHSRNIVHRDIKPDNLLIDSRGHLKLTDFGLSRIGLLNRQVGGPRPAYLRGTSLRGSTRQPQRPLNARNDSNSSAESPLVSPELLPPPPMSTLNQSYFAPLNDAGSADESSGSESVGLITKHMRTLSTVTKLSSDAGTPSVNGREPPRFVGTPDYLAPESILGIGTDDRAVDWWALGVVLYEFLYGIPPFHAETPEKVFDNVVSRRINWHDDEIELSPDARDLMDRLMCPDPIRRLGARGADEVKKHPFFASIDWDTITTAEASFVPEVTDPESTDYFDSRGATHGFHDEDAVPQVLKQAHPALAAATAASPAIASEVGAIIDDMNSQDDFGTFNFKNLPVLKQANDDVIRKLRYDSMAPIGQTLEAAPPMRDRPRSLSTRLRDRRQRRKTSDLTNPPSSAGGPPSPSTSTSSAASTPSRNSVPPSTPGSLPTIPQHFRRPSELNALDRVKSSEESDMLRRASAPIRLRAGSNSSAGGSDKSTSMELWRQRRQASLHIDPTAASSYGTGSSVGISPESPEGKGSGYGSSSRTLDVLIAEDNPISQKILETLLTRMGCRCICVEDGPQALAATMGSIKFDVIIVDIHMPVVNGEQVARMIRSTTNHNQSTPIIAATSYEQHGSITEEGTLFSAILAKPVTKPELIKCLAKLGFVLTSGGSSGSQATTSVASESVTSS